MAHGVGPEILMAKTAQQDRRQMFFQRCAVPLLVASWPFHARYVERARLGALDIHLPSKPQHPDATCLCPARR